MDRYNRLDVREAAKELGLSPEKVVQHCTDGALDACDPEANYEFWIEQKEIQRWKKDGPRPRMGFDEAMELVKTGGLVRRAAWPMEGLTWEVDSFAPDGTVQMRITKWFFREFRYPDGECSRYYPTEEDKVATDWVGYDFAGSGFVKIA